MTALELGDWALAIACTDECQQLNREAADGRQTRFAQRRELDDGITESVRATVAAHRGDTAQAVRLLDAAATTLTPVRALRGLVTPRPGRAVSRARFVPGGVRPYHPCARRR